MEELQNLLAHLKNQGLTDAKIPIDVWCGIIEYFANKEETKQCNIADVVLQGEQLRCPKCHSGELHLWGKKIHCQTCKEVSHRN